MMVRQLAQWRLASPFTLAARMPLEGRQAIGRWVWRLSASSLVVAAAFALPVQAVHVSIPVGMNYVLDAGGQVNYDWLELRGTLHVTNDTQVEVRRFSLINPGALILSNGGTLSNYGQYDASLGSVLAASVIIGASQGEASRAPGVLKLPDSASLYFSSSAGQLFSLVFNHTDDNYVWTTNLATSYPFDNDGVVRQLSGTTIMAGDNQRYAGRFEIKGGTLSVTSANQLGGSNASLLLDGGILRVTGQGFTAHNQNIAVGNNGARIEVTDSAGKLTLGQTTANADADLYKTGEGTLELTGQNTYRDVDVAQGVLDVVQAGTLTSRNGMVGTQASAQGNVGIRGSGSQWVVREGLHVGDGGKGALRISAGGSVSSGRTEIGRSGGVQGSVSVSGAGASWVVNDVFTIGTFGKGALDISSGAQVRQAAISGSVRLGDQAGSEGRVTVSGQGTRWDTNGWSVQIGREGAGALTITDHGAVNVGTTEVAYGANSRGDVLVSGAGANLQVRDALVMGGSDGANASLDIRDGGKVFSPDVRIGAGADSVGSVTVSGMDVSGNSSLLETTSGLFVGGSGAGTLRILDGGRLVTSGDITRIAAYTFSRGLVEVSGILNNQAATWDSAADMQLGAGNNASIVEHSALAIRNGGVVNVGALQADGSHDGTVRLLGNSTYSDFIGSELVIGADVGSAPVAAGTLNAGKVVFVNPPWGSSAERVVFNHDGQTTFSAALQGGVDGNHTIRHLAGTTTLTGDSAGFTGSTVVSGGALLVGDAQGNGVLGGRVDIEHGGTLGGSGRLAGSVIVNDGGTLSAGSSPGTLRIDGDLTLGGKTIFELGTAGVAAGSTNDFISVGGNLQLGGELDARLAAAGRYQLFEHGALSAGSQFSQVSLSSTRSGFAPVSSQVDTRIAGKVFLSALGSGQTLQHWNGVQTTPSGTVTGGDGVWSNWGTNWTNDDGSASAGWAGSVGVFGDQPGTVAVDAGHGPIWFDTLQFSTDGYQLQGGTLAIGAAAGGVFNIDTGVATQVGSIIADAAGTQVVKTGGGTLSLSGQNSYTGGTQVLGGKLEGTVASLRGNIANAGTVVFLQASDATFAGDVGGLSGAAGAMVKQGGGALTLGGASTLDWTVQEGRLQADVGRFHGNTQIAGGAALALQYAGNVAYAGVVTGAGDLGLSGTGTVHLTGDSSAFAGTTSLAGGGTLVVGTAADSGMLGGNLHIGVGGVLAGTGTVGSPGAAVTIAPGAFHAPGNSIGTQTIAGDYINHGTLRIEATPAGADRVVVAGAADIAGATLDLSLSPGEAAAWNVFNGPFTILEKQSQGSVSGAFGQISQNLMFLDQTVDYAGGDGNDVTLSLTRNDKTFASVGRTPNQVSVGSAIDTLGAGSAVWRAIALDSDADSVRASYDALSGEIHASARTALMEDSRLVRQAAHDRMRAAFGAPGAAAAVAPAWRVGAGGVAQPVSNADRGPAVWSQALGSWGSTSSDGNAARVSRSAKGLLLGADRMLGDWRLGVLAGYSRSDIKARDRAASGGSDNYHVGVYGGTQLGRVALRTGAAYTWHRLDTSRSVQVPGMAQRLKSHYRGDTVQVFAEAGVGMTAGTVRLEPFAGLAHVALKTRGASEQGADAALRMAHGRTETTFATLGLRAEQDVSLGAVDATLVGALGWRHAFGDRLPQGRHEIGNAAAFTVTGAPIARNSAVVEAGLSATLGKQTLLGVRYAGQLASGARDHAVKLDLTARF